MYGVSCMHSSFKYMSLVQNLESHWFASVWNSSAGIKLHLCTQILWFKSKQTFCLVSCSSLGLYHAAVAQAVSAGSVELNRAQQHLTFLFLGGLAQDLLFSRGLFFSKRLNWCLWCLYDNTVTDWHPPFQKDAVNIELWSSLAAPSIFHFICFGLGVSSSSCRNISFSFFNCKILICLIFFQNTFISLFLSWPAVGMLLGNFWAAAAA